MERKSGQNREIEKRAGRTGKTPGEYSKVVLEAFSGCLSDAENVIQDAQSKMAKVQIALSVMTAYQLNLEQMQGVLVDICETYEKVAGVRLDLDNMVPILSKTKESQKATK